MPEGAVIPLCYCTVPYFVLRDLPKLSKSGATPFFHTICYLLVYTPHTTAFSTTHNKYCTILKYNRDSSVTKYNVWEKINKTKNTMHLQKISIVFILLS